MSGGHLREPLEVPGGTSMPGPKWDALGLLHDLRRQRHWQAGPRDRGRSGTRASSRWAGG